MKKIILPLLIIMIGLAACSGRIPSQNTAQKIIRKHLNDYGKKYKDTVFSGHKVSQVKIIDLEEIQKNLATGQANVTLDNGTSLDVQMNFIYKMPLGWRQQGWEVLEAAVPPSSSPEN